MRYPKNYSIKILILTILTVAAIYTPHSNRYGDRDTDFNSESNKQGYNDSTYFKRLHEIENILNSEVPGNDFQAIDAVPANYFLIDLTDPANVSKRIPDDRKDGFIRFLDGHFYHIIPVFEKIGYSFIIYIKNDEIVKVFKRINCNHKGNSLEDVLAFAKIELPDDKNSRMIMKRLKKYREGIEFAPPMDNYGEGKPDCN